MVGFKIAVGALAWLAIVTGALDVILGVAAQVNIGVALSDAGLRDSVLNSQIRFLGAVWMGFGVFLLYCLKDLFERTDLLKAALWVVFIGGLGRVISLAQFGLPESAVGQGFVIFAIVAEIVGMPILLYCLSRLTASKATSR